MWLWSNIKTVTTLDADNLGDSGGQLWGFCGRRDNRMQVTNTEFLVKKKNNYIYIYIYEYNYGTWWFPN